MTTRRPTTFAVVVGLTAAGLAFVLGCALGVGGALLVQSRIDREELAFCEARLREAERQAQIRDERLPEVAPAARLPSAVSPRTAPEPTTPPIRRQVRVSRRELLDSVNHQEVRVVPAQRDGQMYGLRVFGVRVDSLPARLGLHNGETVRTVNGTPITNPDAALEVYVTAQTARSIAYESELQGQRYETTVLIDDP